MHEGRPIAAIYAALSAVICAAIIIFVHSCGAGAIASSPASSSAEEDSLTPVQQALLLHISRIEEPDYRHELIYKRIIKILEESYTQESLNFADDVFVPQAGKAYTPKDIVVTDGALILKRYADIPEDTAPQRLMVLNTGSCLINSVPYFWGGKAAHKGWNERWGQDVVVSGDSFIAQTAAESGEAPRPADPEGLQVLVPYGLDCSGFVDWSYWTALNYRIGSNTREQFANSNEISEEELLPGDLGFLCMPQEPMINHVGLYVGKDENGNLMWLHCSSTKGVVISQCGFAYYRRPNIDIYYPDT